MYIIHVWIGPSLYSYNNTYNNGLFTKTYLWAYQAVLYFLQLFGHYFTYII